MERFTAIVLCMVATSCGSRPTAVASDGSVVIGPDQSVPTTKPTPIPGPPARSCPSDPPSPASHCTDNGQVCPYGQVNPQDGECFVVHRCDEHRWLQIVGCLQGGQLGCPATAPVRGSDCRSFTKGQNCYYPPHVDSPCDESSIAQCDGATWRHVNGCPTRDGGTVQETCVIQPTLDPEPVYEKAGKQVDAPAVAVAGTQAMVAMVISGGEDSAHGIYAHRRDTSRPKEEQAVIWPAPYMLVGRDAVSSPALTFTSDRFVLAWQANDGWPQATDHVPGVLVRGIPLNGDPASAEILIDKNGSGVSSLATALEGGWLAYRHPSPNDSQKVKQAVSLVSLGSDLTPSPGAVIADEAAPLAWYQSPMPLAFARVARWSGGFVEVAPAPAAGDLWDDSGIRACFHTTGQSEPACRRLPVGYPSRMSIAAIWDDTAVVAYAGFWDSAPPASGPFRIERVSSDGAGTQISNLIVADGSLAFGPLVVPFDNGFAVAWTTVKNKTGKGGAIHLRLFHVSPSGNTTHPGQGELTQAVPDLRASDRLGLAYAHTDRSLHLVWSTNGSDGLSRVYRQRLICGASL
jgi:hypothetical protein